MIILPLNEIRGDIRKNPEAVSNFCFITFNFIQIVKLLNIASNKALEAVYYNMHGCEFNDFVKLPNNGQMSKDLRDFLNKDPYVDKFLKGFEQKEELILQN